MQKVTLLIIALLISFSAESGSTPYFFVEGKILSFDETHVTLQVEARRVKVPRQYVPDLFTPKPIKVLVSEGEIIIEK